MSHIHSISIIVAKADKAEAERLMLELGRKYAFTVPLSANGRAPATHWGLHTHETPELATMIMGEVAPKIAEEIAREKNATRKARLIADRDKLISPETRSRTSAQVDASRSKMLRSRDRHGEKNGPHFEAFAAAQGLQIIRAGLQQAIPEGSQ